MRIILLAIFSIINFLNFSLSLYANEPGPVFDKLALLHKEMRYQEVIEFIDAQSLPSNDLVNSYKAKVYFLLGEDKIALDVFKKVKLKEWYDYIYLGLIYESLGQEKYAIDNYLRALEKEKNTVAFYRLGKIYYLKNNFLEAARFFQDLIEHDASVSLATYYLGMCALRLKDYERAYSSLSKALNFYPANKEITKNLNAVKEKLGAEFFSQRKQKQEEQRAKVLLPSYEKDYSGVYVDVGLADKLKEFTFRCGGDVTVTDNKKEFVAQANNFYTIVVSDGNLEVYDYNKNNLYARFTKQVFLRSNQHPFYVLNLISGKGAFWHQELDRKYRGDLEVRAYSQGITLINHISIEEYLYAVLPSEIFSWANIEALKAQAVAARTLALKTRGRHKNQGFDFCAGVHCQMYKGIGLETKATTDAVNQTRGEVLTYQGNPIEAFYHSCCGGCVRSDAFAKEGYLAHIFDTKTGEITGKEPSEFSPWEKLNWFFIWPDVFCKNSQASKFRWQRVYDLEDLLLIFGEKVKFIEKIVSKDQAEGFRHQSVKIVYANRESEVVKGDLVIRNYFDSLRSSAFCVELSFSPELKPRWLIFWGAGFGHGVGICQEGAMQMAKDGFKYQEILAHYYPNTEIKKIKYQSSD